MKIRHFVIHSLCLLGLWLGLGLQAHAQTDTVTYVYTDPQGTPLVEADASGNVIARYDYTPYGNAVASLGNPPNGPGYTGHVNDPETGLVYMQARYYQPIGRFLSPDPVGPSAGNVNSFNRYAYANDNPSGNIDPDGRETGQAFVAINRWTTRPYYIGNDREDLNAISDALDAIDRALEPLGPDGGAEFHAAVVPLTGFLREAAAGARAAEAAKDVEEGAAAAERAKNIAKGIPESRLGPSGKPIVHTVEHSTRKAAREAAEKEVPAGGKARFDAHPQDGQKPHFQAEDANGVNVKPVVHHCVPDKSC